MRLTLAHASISIVTILKNISTFAKTALAAICLLAFTSAAFAQAPVQRTVDGIIAKVDNHVVLRSDVEFGYLQYLQQSKQQPNEELTGLIATRSDRPAGGEKCDAH